MGTTVIADSAPSQNLLYNDSPLRILVDSGLDLIVHLLNPALHRPVQVWHCLLDCSVASQIRSDFLDPGI